MSEKIFRIAVLFFADLNDRKGMLNATLDRIRYLKKHLPRNVQCDAICISHYLGPISRRVKKRINQERISGCTIDGIFIRVYWRRFSICDYVLRYKLHLIPCISKLKNYLFCNKLQQYDIISAHSFSAAEIASHVFKRYNIPYCITWHGSDIHSHPFSNRFLLKRTRFLIEHASMNFFVCKALLSKSEEITQKGRKVVLYNGVSPIFRRCNEETKWEMKKKYGIQPKTKVVAFIGNLAPIKNALILPYLFSKIIQKYDGEIYFWIIGDGSLRKKIEEICNNLCISGQVYFLGNMYKRQQQVRMKKLQKSYSRESEIVCQFFLSRNNDS